MKGTVLGGKMHLGLHRQTSCTVNKLNMQPKFSYLHLPTQAALDRKACWWQRSRLQRASGYCSSASQIITYRCQRQPGVFIQESSNLGYDQKPQIGVNISLATFYDIYVFLVSAWSDDSKVFCRLLLPSHPPSAFRCRNSFGAGRMAARRSVLNVRGELFVHPGQAPLSLSGIRASPRCLQIVYISSYSSERMRFQFFVGAQGWREYGPQTTDYLKPLQAGFETFENNLFGNSKSQIAHLATVRCPSVQRLQLKGHNVLCSQATEVASCWITLCGLPV